MFSGLLFPELGGGEKGPQMRSWEEKGFAEGHSETLSG